MCASPPSPFCLLAAVETNDKNAAARQFKQWLPVSANDQLRMQSTAFRTALVINISKKH